MKTALLLSDLRPVEHEFRDYTEDVKKFYEAVKSDDLAIQDQVLHTFDGKGLADIFADDYNLACRVNAEPNYTKCIWISYLYLNLPSPNRAWNKEEEMLVKKLVIAASNGLCPPDVINGKLNQTYREMLQTIKGAKLYLIDLKKSESLNMCVA